MQFELERYTGTKSRFTCPGCGFKHSFARYKGESGEYLSETVGRCNRESKCGYHKKPKEHFAENQLQIGKKKRFRQSKTKAATNYLSTIKNGSQLSSEAFARLKKPDYIERSVLLKTLRNYEQNSFARFLLNLFPEDTEIVEKAIKDYLIGTTKDGKTVFWQIDQNGNVRTGKIIAYDRASGKRRKDISPNWVHAELKKINRLKNDFNLKQCFFGEHLLRDEKEKPVAIVEAEKTAVIAAICFPQLVWIAAGAKQNLKCERLTNFGARKIILYPDADGFVLWREIALKARLEGAAVEVSNLLETYATNEQKANGFDLADYLIEEQMGINAHNEFADKHNAQIEEALRGNNSFQSIALGQNLK